jgi:hypothetical protein
MTPELPTGNAHPSFDWPEGLLEGAGVGDGVLNDVVGATYSDVWFASKNKIRAGSKSDEIKIRSKIRCI